MSLRYEQHRALLLAHDLLVDLLHHSTRPKTVKELKQRASSALKHFPILRHDGAPIFSNDEIPPQRHFP